MDENRRKFLQVMAGSVVAGGCLYVINPAKAKPMVRPPGAVTEPDFLARCQRCMRCVEACQPAALTIGHLSDGFVNLGTPVLDISKCIQCMDCMRVCPSGALSKVSKKELRMGLAVINKNSCLTFTEKTQCKKCFDICSKEFKAIKLEKKLLKKKKNWKAPVIDPLKCTGCGACMRVCQKQCPPEGAITLDTSKIKRFDPPKGNYAVELENRTEVMPQKPFAEWLKERLQKLAQSYGMSETTGKK